MPACVCRALPPVVGIITHCRDCIYCGKVSGSGARPKFSANYRATILRGIKHAGMVITVRNRSSLLRRSRSKSPGRYSRIAAADGARRPRKWRSRFFFNSAAVLRERNFRRFYAGYVTSLFGTSMSTVALAFAVLDGGGSAADLGYVFAAGVVPQVAFMLGGGVVADRLGRRPVMLAADLVRFAAQATLAAALLARTPPIWQFVALSGLLGSGEAFFAPSLAALTPDIAPPARLSDANALLGLAQSAARVTGPAAAGILAAITAPGVVIALDAASYGASVLALGVLRLPAAAP